MKKKRRKALVGKLLPAPLQQRFGTGTIKKNKKEKVKFMIINELYYASENVKKIDMLL